MPCLDIKVVDGVPSVVKGVKFVDLKRQGDPVEFARRYQEQGADELVFLDITAFMRAERPWWMWPGRLPMLWIFPLL